MNKQSLIKVAYAMRGGGDYLAWYLQYSAALSASYFLAESLPIQVCVLELKNIRFSSSLEKSNIPFIDKILRLFCARGWWIN
jgi:hypothetical protein